MAQYKYTGLGWNGAMISGTVEAFSESEAMLRLHDTCEVVLNIKKELFRKSGTWDSVDEEEEKRSILDVEIGPPKLDLKIFSVMCKQFSVILRGGMPVARTVQMVGDTLQDRMLRRWLRKVLRDVESGMSLADSMANRGSDFLPSTFVETIRAGEASGNLDLSFGNMARHFEKRYKTQAQVRSAMAYPALLVVVAIGVMAVIMVYVVPTFTKIFESANYPIPAITRAVIGLSKFFQQYWWSVLIFAAVCFILYKILDHVPRVHLLFAQAVLKIPVIGEIVLLNSVCQFTSTLAALVASGLTIVNAAEISSKVVSNAYVSKRVGELPEMLQRGVSLGDGMRALNVLPVMLTEMTAMGENSGELVETLDFISEYYEAELDAASASALKKLGPAMLVVIGGLSVFLIAGVYAGMFSMYGAMGDAMGLGGNGN